MKKTSAKILVVDDDPEIVEILKYNLSNSDFEVKVYDPLVKKDQITLDLKVLFESLNYSDTLIKKKLKKLKIFSSANEAIKGSEVIAILTEWNEFKNYDWNLIAKNKKLTIVDGRNILTKLKLNDNNINYIKL